MSEKIEDQMRTERTEEVTDKKCPNCGATVTFDPQSGTLHCAYCGYSCELPKDTENDPMRELDFESAVNKGSFEWGAQKKTVECKNCGAVTIYDALETASVCPFCGSTHVMPAADEESIAPGGVCPFSLTKESAGHAFQKWLSKKLFAPSKAKKNASPDAFKGVYLPFWTFDAQTDSHFTARAGYDRKVRKKDGSTTTETTWNWVSGEYQEFIDDETVVASDRYEHTNVKSCEPFDFSKLVPYDPKLLAGFVAERYSIGLKKGWEIAQEAIQVRLKNNVKSHVKRHWRADRADSVKLSTHYSNITYKYLLVPVWLSSFSYKDKVYQFVVNGQTGKVAGKAPVSAFRVILAILLAAAVIAGLYFLGQYN